MNPSPGSWPIIELFYGNLSTKEILILAIMVINLNILKKHAWFPTPAYLLLIIWGQHSG